MMDKQQIVAMIEAGLPGASAVVHGDDGRHFSAQIYFEGFQGKTKLQQHRMVYQALGENMKEAIHALSIETFTKESS